MMSHPKDGPEMVKCPGRYQSMFLRICAITLLVTLVFYTVTISNVNVTTDVRSWNNISKFLKSAAFRFQSAISRPPRKTKIVILWTSFFSQGGDWLPSTVDLECPVTECIATSDRELLQNSSAVVLHWRNVNTSDLPVCSATDDAQCPLWILFNQEAPPHTHRAVMEMLEGRVHWTATFRRSSDIWTPYGKIGVSKSLNYTKPEFDRSKRLVCWLVSNCETPSKREDFVEELEKYIDVDKYGSCGSLRCPHALAKDCYRWLSEKCLFYLSLENSMCRDYTTEKLYYALSYDMVPVVMGDDSNYRHLPRHSYINAADYSSPKHLAEYLVKVGKSKRLYESYMSWKRRYEVLDTSYKWFCDICLKLHEEVTLNYKPMQNLVGWWYNESECRSWPNL